MLRHCVVPLLVCTLLAVCAAQSSPAQQLETTPDLVAKLTPAQKQQFDAAIQAHKAHQYADELAKLKALLAQMSNDSVLAKFAAEAALNAEQAAFALAAVKPVAQANANDWQAAALLTRACAESGDISCRDSCMEHMRDLHTKAITPPNVHEYKIEQVKVGDNLLVMFASLEPWGYYRVYNTGDVSDIIGKHFLTITLESNDGDQELFAQEHPTDAKQGQRRFSLDAYRETGVNNDGKRTQTHYTYQFFTGQPSYAEVREAFIAIANGKRQAISSRTGLVVP